MAYIQADSTSPKAAPPPACSARVYEVMHAWKSSRCAKHTKKTQMRGATKVPTACAHLEHQGVGSDAHVEGVGLGPALALGGALLGACGAGQERGRDGERAGGVAAKLALMCCRCAVGWVG